MLGNCNFVTFYRVPYGHPPSLYECMAFNGPPPTLGSQLWLIHLSVILKINWSIPAPKSSPFSQAINNDRGSLIVRSCKQTHLKIWQSCLLAVRFHLYCNCCALELVMERTVHNTDPSDNVEKWGEAKKKINLGEAKNRNLCRTKFPLLQDLLYGDIQFLNTILESLPCSVTELLY